LPLPYILVVNDELIVLLGYEFMIESPGFEGCFSSLFIDINFVCADEGIWPARFTFSLDGAN